MPAGRPKKPGMKSIFPRVRPETYEALKRDSDRLALTLGQVIDRWAEERLARGAEK